MTPLLGARSVGLSVSGSVILEDVSLSVGRGEFVAVIGPNGAGKSSLLKCLGGLVRPTSWEVLLEGRPLGRLSTNSAATRRACCTSFRRSCTPVGPSTRNSRAAYPCR